jgi:hypothetical protein
VIEEFGSSDEDAEITVSHDISCSGVGARPAWRRQETQLLEQRRQRLDRHNGERGSGMIAERKEGEHHWNPGLLGGRLTEINGHGFKL